MTLGELLALLIAASAFAQTPPGPAQPPSPDQTPSRWEVEGYGGFSSRVESTGSATLPAAGPPITTSNPTFPSRQVPSWFFGDGSTLLNGAITDLGLQGGITSLDPAFDSLGFGDRGLAAGVRARRTLTPRLSAELSLDVLTGTPTLSGAFLAAVESTRSSFVNAFAGLFGSGPFSGTTVSATAVTANGSGQQLAGTGAIRVMFGPRFHVVPYITVGGGILGRHGSLPSVVLQGNYQALVGGSVPINETDHVVVRYQQSASPIAVLGGGLRRAVSDRWGLDFDVRALVGPPPVAVLIDAAPSVVQATPAGFIETFTYPSVQFSNNPSTGRSSSLSGGLQGFSAFSGGITAHVIVAVGIYARF